MKNHLSLRHYAKVVALFLCSAGFTNIATAESFTFEGIEVKTLVCRPSTQDITAGVIYHHGSRYAGGVGGAPVETCKELAKLDYVGIIPIRPDLRSREEIIRFVQASIEYAKSISQVDAARIGVIGYSQGGVLAYLTATVSKDLKAAVVLAAGAGPKGGSYGADQVEAPILIMVAENDVGSSTSLGRNFRVETKQLFDGLKAHKKDVQYAILPSIDNDGHKIFWKIGPYWEFVKMFLQDKLR